MKLITGPHELLVRFGRDRKLQGYHLITVTQACNDDGTPLFNPDGSVFLEQFSEAQTLERAIAAGLPFADLDGVITEAQAQAIHRMDAAIAQAVEAKAQMEAAQAQAKESEARVVALDANVVLLQTQLGQLQEQMKEVPHEG